MRVPVNLRAMLPAAAAGAGLAFGVISASAADQTVQIVAVNGTSCTAEFCYVPSSVNAGSGDTITWSNQSPDFHTVTRCSTAACSGQGPGTGADALGSPGNITPVTGAYAHTFTSPGTYFYYCSIHGYGVMHGQVTVAAAPVADTPEAPAGVLLIVAAGAVTGVAVTLARQRRARRDAS